MKPVENIPGIRGGGDIGERYGGIQVWYIW
jgi:hypothetical protein